MVNLNTLSFIILITAVFLAGGTFFYWLIKRDNKTIISNLTTQWNLPRPQSSDLTSLFQEILSEKKEVECLYQQVKSEIYLFLDHSAFAFAFYNEKNGILEFNQTFASLTGLSPFRKSIHISEFPVFGPLITGPIEAIRQIEVGELKLTIKVMQGSGFRFIEFLDRKKNEDELAFRKYFSNALWHEIKTPLTVIKGYIDLFFDETPQTENRESLLKINRQVERIENLINHLRLLTGDVARDRGLCQILSVSGMIASILQLWNEDIEKNHLNIIYPQEPFDNKNDSLYINRGDMYILLSNLISNAIRFNQPAGKVSMIFDYQPLTFIFSINNTGKVISPDLQEIIHRNIDYFTGFGEKSQGLGLFLAKEAALRGRGRIALRSGSEAGTTFQVFLPIISSPIKEEKPF